MSYLRKIFTACVLIAFANLTNAQVTVLSEDFEHAGAQPPTWTTSTTGVPTHVWTANSKFQTNFTYCDSATRYVGDTLILTSPIFSTSALTFVTIEFDHICDISGFDTARLQVRAGTGPWVTISRDTFYEGLPVGSGGAFWGSAGKSQGFNSLSYVFPWAQPLATSNSFWRHETFNASSVIQNQTSAQIRFILEASNGGGNPNQSGWFLDKIRVVGDSCETIKPLGGQIAPFIANKSVQFSLGPYTLKSEWEDKNSGIDTVMILYKVNTAPWDTVYKSRPNIAGQPKRWEGQIPKTYNNGLDTIKAGDSVCYIIRAFDKSIPCRNYASAPAPLGFDTCNLFYVSNGETLPFCDNFDVNNFWTDSISPLTTTTVWHRGTPGTGGAFSPPTAWATSLTSNYSNNVEGYLYSPVFDFGNAKTPRLTFWQNRIMQNDGDLLQLQYSISGNPFITLGKANDSAGVNLNTPSCPSTWYQASGPGSTPNSWNGNSGGWVQCFYQLPATFNGAGSVRFRFRFKSDAANNSFGVSIDDFCLENPPQFDISTIEVIAPGDWTDNTDHNHYIRAQGEQDSVVVVFRNIGTDTIYNLPARFISDTAGGPPQIVNETFSYPRTWNGKIKPYLRPLEADTFLFTNGYRVPFGNYSLRALPTLPGDADASNDTGLTKGHFGFITSALTFETDFESGDIWSTTPFPVGECGKPASFGGTRWEKGKPNWGVTNSTLSGVNAWDINRTTAYTVNQDEFLYTQFFDLSNWDKAFVSFWQNRNTTSGLDGFTIEYNLDKNNPNWTPLQSGVTGGLPGEINWYSNSAIPGFGGRDGWTGNSSGWIYSEFPIENLPTLIPTGAAASQVQFRFIFHSDNTYNATEDGVSIDDFRVVNPQLYDVEIVRFEEPVRECVMDLREPVTIEVKNVGKLDIDSIPVKYRFYNTTVGSPVPWTSAVTDTIFDTLSPGESIIWTFENDSADMTVFGIYEFDAIVDHVTLDTNQTNDTLFGYRVENVEGCDIEVELTTGSAIPVGSKLYMIDTTMVPYDTIYEESFSNIGINAIQYTFEICMANVGDYKFVIDPVAANFISSWRLTDLFADTLMGSGTGATGPNGYGFHWECPPLLSASSEQIKLHGSLRQLPIPQDYLIRGEFKNRGLFAIRNLEINLNIEKIFPTPVIPTVLSQTDTVYYGGQGLTTLAFKKDTFNTIWSAEPGEYNICIWSRIPNGNPDNATFDDTTCLNFVVLDTSSAPYCNNFDGNMNPWGSLSKNEYDTNSTFQKGAPAQGTLNSAVSNPNAWMTGLSSDYVILDSSGIYSPLFAVKDTAACYQVSFNHEFKTEKSFDGGVIEYSVDSGLTWRTMGLISDTLYPMSTTQWYNTPYIVGLEGSPQPAGFSGESNGVWASSYDLKFPDFGKTSFVVVFRFRFGADASINDEGWLIDDFCFEKKGNCVYVSCTDEIQNQGETGVDCGGPNCAPCESCNDGIQNQNETGIDCGGKCAPCPSCVDNELNGNEVKPDCGGDCAPCATCDDGIRNWHWVETPAGSGNYVREREGGIDCGGPCPSCWVGIEDLSENEFGLSQNVPNPTEDKAIIYYSVPSTGNVNIQIQNLLGQVMHQETIKSTQGVNQFELNVDDWADGIYYYSFEFKGERLVRKMTVSK